MFVVVATRNFVAMMNYNSETEETARHSEGLLHIQSYVCILRSLELYSKSASITT